MYHNRKDVRDIISRVRTNTFTHTKAVQIAAKERKQLATLYHDIISEVIDEMYAETIAELDEKKEPNCA
jgi:hypothetical protein